MKKLLAYLKRNKHLLNIKAIETAAKMPATTLDKFIKEERDLNLRHTMNLLETLIKIGGGVFQLGDTMFKEVSDHQEFEAFAIVETFDPIEKFNDKGDTTHFEYPAHLSRDIVTDDVDLLMYL